MTTEGIECVAGPIQRPLDGRTPIHHATCALDARNRITMRTLIIACLASLAACTSSNRYAIGSADGIHAPGSRCSGECEARAECRPDGTCVVTCTSDDGSQCEFVIECDEPCGASKCTTGPCDVDVECLPDGRCRITCTSDDGSTCETVVVECGADCKS